MLNAKGRAELAHSRAILAHGSGRNRIETSINCIDDIRWTSMILRGLCDRLDDIAENKTLRPAYVMSIARREIYSAHLDLKDAASENVEKNVKERWDSNVRNAS